MVTNKAFIKAFGVQRQSTDSIVQVLEARLDKTIFLITMEKLHENVEMTNIDGIARYGLLRSSVGRRLDLAEFAI